tara:strand:+ start:164 stop:493 length:330 start_codon:yes stop_codon:yes gene_type:complete
MARSIFAHRRRHHGTTGSLLGDIGRSFIHPHKKNMRKQPPPPPSNVIGSGIRVDKAKKAVVGKIPHAKIAVAVSKVGSAKLGHGGFCHANKIDNMAGSRHSGKGLRRVV